MLALQGYALLPTLASGASPGARLAAAMFLEAVPDPQYVSWLVERFRAEKPFIAYHAAQALLAMVRVSSSHECSILKTALDSAETVLREQLADRAEASDRYHVITEARREWKVRCGDGARVSSPRRQ